MIRSPLRVISLVLLVSGVALVGTALATTREAWNPRTRVVNLNNDTLWLFMTGMVAGIGGAVIALTADPD